MFIMKYVESRNYEGYLQNQVCSISHSGILKLGDGQDEAILGGDASHSVMPSDFQTNNEKSKMYMLMNSMNNMDESRLLTML